MRVHIGQLTLGLVLGLAIGFPIGKYTFEEPKTSIFLDKREVADLPPKNYAIITAEKGEVICLNGTPDEELLEKIGQIVK